MFRHLKCHPQGAHCALLKLHFIVLYFNNFILLRPENLYVISAKHNELPEDGILNVETRRSIFVIIVFDIIVQ